MRPHLPRGPAHPTRGGEQTNPLVSPGLTQEKTPNVIPSSETPTSRWWSVLLYRCRGCRDLESPRLAGLGVAGGAAAHGTQATEERRPGRWCCRRALLPSHCVLSAGAKPGVNPGETCRTSFLPCPEVGDGPTCQRRDGDTAEEVPGQRPSSLSALPTFCFSHPTGSRTEVTRSPGGVSSCRLENWQVRVSGEQGQRVLWGRRGWSTPCPLVPRGRQPCRLPRVMGGRQSHEPGQCPHREESRAQPCDSACMSMAP